MDGLLPPLPPPLPPVDGDTTAEVVRATLAPTVPALAGLAAPPPPPPVDGDTTAEVVRATLAPAVPALAGLAAPAALSAANASASAEAAPNERMRRIRATLPTFWRTSRRACAVIAPPAPPALPAPPAPLAPACAPIAAGISSIAIGTATGTELALFGNTDNAAAPVACGTAATATFSGELGSAAGIAATAMAGGIITAHGISRSPPSGLPPSGLLVIRVWR